ncbi:MAG: ATPase, T2SS/T4P/T4SS family, partial [Gammaproteobacteria bacterium]
MANASLQQTMSPLAIYLQDEAINEIMINRPNEVWLDNGKAIFQHKIDFPLRLMQRFANLIAAESGQEINEQKPLLSAMLPGGHRVQLILSPACKCLDEEQQWQDTVCLSIRKKSDAILDLNTFTSQGGFTQLSDKTDTKINKLTELYSLKQYQEFLIKAVQYKKNILISGGTYSGKTSLLNMLLDCIDKDERIISIEDTPELKIPSKNQVRLFYSRGMQSSAQITSHDLLNAALRMRPDRI